MIDKDDIVFIRHEILIVAITIALSCEANAPPNANTKVRREPISIMTKEDPINNDSDIFPFMISRTKIDCRPKVVKKANSET